MEIVEIQCVKSYCGHSPFPMARQFYQRAKKTHEDWTCPAGHHQHFTGQTEEQREIEALKSRAAWLSEMVDYLKDELDKERRSCPWVGCEFVAGGKVESWDRRPLWNHMRAIHGMPSLAEVEEAS